MLGLTWRALASFLASGVFTAVESLLLASMGTESRGVFGARVVTEPFAVGDLLLMIAGRRDGADRVSDGDISARRPVAPRRGNPIFVLRRRRSTESSELSQSATCCKQ